MSIFKFVSRILIGFLFLFSGSQKILVPLENFEEALRAYEIFPESSIVFLSHFVPIAEVVLGLCLLIGVFYGLCLLASTLFFSSFVFVISRALWLGLPIEDCGCFGSTLTVEPVHMLGIDILFLCLSLFLLLTKPRTYRSKHGQ